MQHRRCGKARNFTAGRRQPHLETLKNKASLWYMTAPVRRYMEYKLWLHSKIPAHIQYLLSTFLFRIFFFKRLFPFMFLAHYCHDKQEVCNLLMLLSWCFMLDSHSRTNLYDTKDGKLLLSPLDVHLF